MVILLRFGLLALILWSAVVAWTWNTYQPLTPPTKKTVGLARREIEPHRLPATSVKKSLLILQKTDLWGSKQKADPAAGLTPGNTGTTVEMETWNRVAVVKDPQGAYILLRSPAGELKAFKAGDVLPDESKLKKINTDTIEVRLINGKAKTYRFMD